MLTSLGVAGDTDTRAELVENLDDLVVEVIDDLYLRKFGRAGATSRRSARRRARSWPEPRSATRRPGWSHGRADRAPLAAASASASRSAVRASSTRRKRRLGVLGYDDLLSRLAEALEADDAPARHGCASAGRSCWSTSSRTPTRCSGTCSTALSAGTRRWS